MGSFVTSDLEEGRSRAPSRWMLAALAAAAVVAFHNTFSVPFCLDDWASITDNESIRHLWPVGPVLFPPPDVLSAGRPLLNLTYAINYAIGGLSPAGFHLVNLAIHLGAALTLFGILRRTLALPALRERFGVAGPWLAFAAASLWVVHPLQVNSVTYLSQRAESLMGLFYLLTFYCFIRGVERPRSWWPVLSVASCLAGVATKEVAVTAPILVLLYDRTFIAGSFGRAWSERRRLHVALFSSGVVTVALMLTTRLAARGVGLGFDYSWHGYLLIEFQALARYVALFFWPFPLVFDYGPDLPVPTLMAVAPCAALVMAAFIAGIVLLRRAPRIGFLVCWFFIILLPTSSVIPVSGQPIGENRVYLPLIAAMVLLALAVHRLPPRAALGTIAAILGALTLLTISRNRTLQNELTLWVDTLQKSPGNSRAHYYYGLALARAGRIEEALHEFETSIKIRPFHATYDKLGYAFTSLGRFEDARVPLEHAVALKPDAPGYRANLGAVYYQLHRWNDAVDQYQQALARAPKSVAARVGLGIMFGRMGRYAESITEFEHVLKLDPENAEAIKSLNQLRPLLEAQVRAPR